MAGSPKREAIPGLFPIDVLIALLEIVNILIRIILPTEKESRHKLNTNKTYARTQSGPYSPCLGTLCFISTTTSSSVLCEKFYHGMMNLALVESCCCIAHLGWKDKKKLEGSIFTCLVSYGAYTHYYDGSRVE